MQKNRNWLLAILSGLLLGLSFPPYPFFILAFTGFIPLFFIFDSDVLPKNKYRLLYITFFIFHGLTNWWISSWRAETDPFLMASGIVLWLFHPFFFMVPFALTFLIKKRIGNRAAFIAFPFAWSLFEWAHSLSDLSYPWLTLGATQLYNKYWVQFIDITGVWGASFLIVFSNVILYYLYRNFKLHKMAGKPASTFFANVPNLILLALLLLPNGAAKFYGLAQFSEFEHEKLLKENKSIKIGVIQPAVNPWRKWDRDGVAQIYKHINIMDSLNRTVPGLDMCIWSETAFPYLGLGINAYHDYGFLRDYLNRSGLSLMTGFSELDIYESGETVPPTAKYFRNDSNMRYDTYNAALMLNPNQLNMKPKLYRKSRLTPFAEKMPFAESLPFMQKWLSWGVGISAWAKGKEQFPLYADNGRNTAYIGSVICIESIYPECVANFVRSGAEILSVITNDAWYDYTIGPEQHYAIACIRAIENKRYLARCANTGVSGFITPLGESLSRAEHYQATAVAERLPKLRQQTFYTAHGEWFISILSLGLGIICVVFVVLKRKKTS